MRSGGVWGRRDFLKAGALGLAGSTLTSALPSTARGEDGVASWGRTTADVKPTSAFEFEEWTLGDFANALNSGAHTSVSITRAYLERIESLDRQGPTLRSMLEINPDAMAQAEAADRARQAARLRSPLHGIPIVIKGNIDTGDRMGTSAGSLALAQASASSDAHVAAKLRESGAILLGKTNLSEWANFRSTHSSSGWSGVGGQCGNPYALDRSPCGSSSGSGAAVSGNLAPIAVGTETDGSIVCPSSLCGIVGIKPTLGLISRAGIIPIAHSQDTAGPMARTVTDAAILLGALTGVDSRDPATTASAEHAGTDYTRFLDPRGLRGARLGAPRKRLFGYHDATDKLIEQAMNALRREGAEVIDLPELPHLGEYDESEYEVLLYEFKADLNTYLTARGATVESHSLAELIEWNERNRATSMPYFGQEIFLQAQEKGPLTEPAYLDALAKGQHLSREEGIDALMNEHRLDALIAPTCSPAWTIDLVTGDHYLGAASTPAAVAGYPHITVPAGFLFGLPVGLSFFGRAWSEPTLIRLAYAFEQATSARRAPRFLPTAELG